MNAADPWGLCKVKDGKLVECKITRDKNLTKAEKKAADEFEKRLVEIGEAINKSGNQDQIDAFESIDEVVFSSTFQSPTGGAATASRNDDIDAVKKGKGTDILTFYGQALGTGGTSDVAKQVAGHEVEHFTQRDRDIHRMNSGNVFMERRAEIGTDTRAIGWMQKNGILPSPYTSGSSYTAGRVFRK